MKRPLRWVLLLAVFAVAWFLGRYVPRSYDSVYVPLLIVLAVILLLLGVRIRRRSYKSDGT